MSEMWFANLVTDVVVVYCLFFHFILPTVMLIPIWFWEKQKVNLLFAASKQ